MYGNPTHLSLCAGIGGIDLGLRRVVRGIRTVAMVERETFCIANLVKAMEQGTLDSCPIYPDLLRFPWNRYRGVVDIVSGGFPCQPFSISGSRKATEDERHLWPHIKSGVAVLNPKVCFFENVDGIITARSPGYHSVLHHVLCDLESMGYRATAGQFTAEEVGAPHLRKRWFILAHSRCDDASARRECSTAQAGSRGGDEQGGSRFDAGERHLETTGQAPVMAYTNSQRLERRDEPFGQCTDQWPARAGCTQRSNEPARTVVPGLGRYVDGVPSRVDRLRALGNAVVPAVAARAFSTLWHRLESEHA